MENTYEYVLISAFFCQLCFYEIKSFGGAIACFIWAIVVKLSYWENPIFLHITFFASQKYMYIKK